MDITISFFVPGTARTAGSKNAFKHPHTGKIIITHASTKTKDWMDSVKWFAMKKYGERAVLLIGAIKLELLFLSDRPKGHYGSGRNAGCLKSSAPLNKLTKPDLTKLTRAVEDALTGIIWKDDAQVVQQETEKRYCWGEERPGVLITIKEPKPATSNL